MRTIATIRIVKNIGFESHFSRAMSTISVANIIAPEKMNTAPIKIEGKDHSIKG